MNKYIHICGDFYLKYDDYQIVDKTREELNAERFEAEIRSDFCFKPEKQKKLYTSVEVVRVQ